MPYYNTLFGAILSAIVLASTTFGAVADTVLVMVEERGCMWCARWNEDIAPVYAKTREGQAAPLHRIDINAPLPGGMTFAHALRFTPTFVLMVDGQEAARIEGYPGEDFFWGLLGKMLLETKIAISRKES